MSCFYITLIHLNFIFSLLLFRLNGIYGLTGSKKDVSCLKGSFGNLWFWGKFFCIEAISERHFWRHWRKYLSGKRRWRGPSLVNLIRFGSFTPIFMCRSHKTFIKRIFTSTKHNSYQIVHQYQFKFIDFWQFPQKKTVY